jgi:hypothetical protein
MHKTMCLNAVRGATTYPDVGMSDVVSGIIAGKKWVFHHELRHTWQKQWVCHDICDINYMVVVPMNPII